MAKKTFSKNVDAALETAAAEEANLGELETLFKEIPVATPSGDDLLGEIMATISDYTTKEEPLAEFAPIVPEEKAPKTPDPAQLGDETGISTDFVRRVEKAAKSGKKIAEAEQIAKATTPPPQAVTGEHYGYTDPQDADALTPDQPPLSAPREPLTPEQTEMNGIAAEELIEWYDAIQAGSAVWAYDYFTSPKKTTKIVEALYPKISKGAATQPEREMFEQAQAAMIGYTKRKGLFADGAPMSATIKQRSIRLLDKILEVRGITIPPEILLGLLLLTPVVMNLSKIWIEKSGHSGGDELLGKFEQFVTKQEAGYWKEQKSNQPKP